MQKFHLFLLEYSEGKLVPEGKVARKNLFSFDMREKIKKISRQIEKYLKWKIATLRRRKILQGGKYYL